MESIRNLSEGLLTAHELAKILLEFPDYPVKVAGWGKEINNIEVGETLVTPNPGEELGKIVLFTFDVIEPEGEQKKYMMKQNNILQNGNKGNL